MSWASEIVSVQIAGKSIEVRIRYRNGEREIQMDYSLSDENASRAVLAGLARQQCERLDATEVEAEAMIAAIGSDPRELAE